MAYFDEFRANARPLIGAAIGAGVGSYLTGYIMSVFAPHFITEFGWSRSQFALLGTTALVVFFILPVIGRVADLLGTRKVALVGILGIPACYVAMSFMTGSFLLFVAINILSLILASAAGAVTYTRIVAQRFSRARGLALTVITCAPAVVGAIGTPLINTYVDAQGWRSGLHVVAGFILLTGGLALLLIGPTGNPVRARKGPRSKDAYAYLFSMRAFWLIAIGNALCNIPTVLHTNQLKLMLLDNGMASATAAWLISVYASSTVVGRIICGLALDRFSPKVVSAIFMALPFLGMVALALPMDSVPVILFSVALIGLSVGAESDIIAFLVARYFRVDIYSTAYGTIACLSPVAVALGSLSLALLLHQYDSFAPFLWFSAAVTLIGGALFLGLSEPLERRPAEAATGD